MSRKREHERRTARHAETEGPVEVNRRILQNMSQRAHAAVLCISAVRYIMPPAPMLRDAPLSQGTHGAVAGKRRRTVEYLGDLGHAVSVSQRGSAGYIRLNAGGEEL